MNISIHIERLVLDGITVPTHQRPALQVAVTAELTRLLADGSLQPGLLAGGEMPYLPGGNIQLSNQTSPFNLGQQIAQAVYGGLNQ